MAAQLSLWARDDTRFANDSPVVLTIRESRRARRLILQALPPRTVEIVVPKGMRADSVQRFIREHRGWIDRAGAEMLAAYPEPDLRPSLLDLPAVARQIRVRYLEASGGRARYRVVGDELRLYSTRPDRADSLPLLRRWLLAQGNLLLKPWLRRESEVTGLSPGRIHVRLQKTRWGSCSSQGNININAALLLVPPELVRYLFVHELAHLRQLSHGRRFWQLVARHEPDYRALDQRLASCWHELPAWLFALTRGEVA